MDSDTNSNITVYHTTSQLENSDLETPDEIDYSEPSRSTFFQPPFQPLYSQTRDEPPSTPSYISNVTPTYSPLSSERSNNNSPEDTQISYELDNFIPSLHPSSSSYPSSSSTNRAYRTFKIKLPNHPFPSHPGTART